VRRANTRKLINERRIGSDGHIGLAENIAVEPVDEGGDRHVTLPADREELAGLVFDAPLAPFRAGFSAVVRAR
jgi:hypothetical protein